MEQSSNFISFKQPYPGARNSIQEYLFSLFILVGAYRAGNVPAVLVYSKFQSVPGDIFTALEGGVGTTATFFLLLLPWITVFIAFFPISKFILKWPVRFFVSTRPKIDSKRFLFTFVLWFLMCLVTFFATKNELVLNSFRADKFIPLFIVASVVLLIQCAAEELVFRSFLLKWIGRKASMGWLQVVITGAVFGYLHGSNPEVDAIGKIALIYYIGTGIFLGLITVLDDGLELAIGFHYANNLFAALIVTSNWQVFRTDAVFIDTNPPAFTLADFAFAFGGQLVFFLICRNVFKWKAMRSKLI